MPRKPDPTTQAAHQLLTAFRQLPWPIQLAVLVAGLVLVGVVLWVRSGSRPAPEPSPTAPGAEPTTTPGSTAPGASPAGFPPGARTVVFCLWNLENLFDDQPDRRSHTADKEFDAWLANDPQARQLKYQRLSEALLRLNAGVGPDIIVGIEVESVRAAQLLREALNARLPAGAEPYQFVAMKELNAGRHIAPAVISRYPLGPAQLRGRLQRILEVPVTVNGHELIVVASHWTSQLSDDGKRTSGGRAGYATTIAQRYRELVDANPQVDFLVCGDFNDTPEAEPIRDILGLVADARLVTPEARPPRLLGLLSGKSPQQYGTHYYNQPLIYDHIGVSAGLLDTHGWGVVPDSVRVPTEGLTRSGTRLRRPWRFGSRDDDAVGRGYSDHFPVLATFHVAP